MKGIIFNLLEDFIVEGWGAQRFERIFSACPLQTKTPFVGPGTYPDSDLMMLVERVCAELGIEKDAALRAFGRFAMPRLANKFDGFVSAYRHPKPFLCTVDGVIHLEVRKLMTKAEPPRIQFHDPSPAQLVLHYWSKRQLCALFEGLLDGTADYFGVPFTIQQTACMSRGAPTCDFLLEFSR
jgi:predicted hydrocarbon binding protein